MSLAKKSVSKPISPKKRFVLSILDLAKKDPQIGALMPNPTLREAVNRPDISLDRIIETFLNGYSNRPALAERSYTITKNENGLATRTYLSEYNTITYKELHHRIKGLANAWQFHPNCAIQPNEFVATIGFTSPDFAVIDYACVYAQTVSIPLQSSTSGADLDEIFANTRPAALAASINDVELAAKHAIHHPSIRSIIAFDYEEKDKTELEKFEAAQKILQSANKKISLVTLSQLIEYGNQKEWTFLPTHKEGEERMVAIVHSSGSTGKPKGAIMPERAVKHTWIGRKTQLPKVTVMFAPMNHIMGRNALINTLNCGGTAYFTLKPDMSTLFEDIRLARPTYLTFFPRAFELIYQDYQNEVSRRLKMSKVDRAEVEAAVKKEMKTSYLGDRLRGGVVGSAPTSPAVRDFIRDCFDILLQDGYGNTESGTGSVTIDGIIDRATVMDYKLRDVPELGYYTTDKPYPRGELCIKSRWGITGYYKQPEASKGLFDEDGYSLTGDIVEERAPDYVAVIDRRKDVLKLSQGEYVAVGTLGTIFEAESAVIRQIYIYGNSHRSYLLAVIVPEMEIVESILGKQPSNNKLKSFIRKELQQVAQSETLKSFEVPRDFIIEKEEFSQKNGLLSSVRKRLRPALKKKYASQLEALYEEQAKGQETALAELKDPNLGLATTEKIIRLLEINLGIEDIPLDTESTFSELGGDSLGAVIFSKAIEEIFEVLIPANTILSPTSNPQQWVRLIKEAQETINQQPTFKNIHGKNAQTIPANDLQLVKFIGEEVMQNATTAEAYTTEPKSVLLTGANGFLGHILCLEWLEKLATKKGKLICLIRAKDDQAARQRLDQAFGGLDARMEKRYQRLAYQHLEVLAGDVAAPNLGLGEVTFQRLAQKVESICHPAALVNHRFGYEHLFGPNVVGTAEIIRLAITTRKKPIDFISSVAVDRFLDIGNGKNEVAPLLETIELRDRYAVGYGASKWAAEHLLQRAHKNFDLPINIFRSDMILAHQQYKGQINAADMLTRLLYSMMVTGLAPESFYQLNNDGSQAKGHYDGIPVDVIAKAVVGVSENIQPNYQVYNVQNYHQADGISLDSFVDWIKSAGYPIQKLPHQQWFERIKDKLNTLPEEQKQHTALDILAAFSRPYPPNLQSSDCTNFKQLIKDLKELKDIPHLSERFIHKCLTDMNLLGIKI